MTELISPMMYGAYHAVEPVTLAADRAEVTCDVVGPLCESQRHDRARTAGCRGRRSATCSRSATPGLQRRHGVQLQPSPDAGRSDGRQRARRGHSPPADDRRPAGPGDLTCSRPGLLIAFEGLDQSGKQTQAEALRDDFTSRSRPRLPAAVVSRLHHADRRRDRTARSMASTIRPGRHATPLHRQPLRASASDLSR